ncbi:progesterone receptor isoform X1 [Lissotriton helveticus]
MADQEKTTYPCSSSTSQKVDQSISSIHLDKGNVLQTPPGSLDKLIYKDSQLESPPFPEGDDMSMESALDKVFVESFLTSVPGQAKSFELWSPFDMEEMASATTVSSDTNNTKISTSGDRSPGVVSSSSFLHENTLEQIKAAPDPGTEKNKVTPNQESILGVTRVRQESTFRPINLDFFRMPIVPLSQTFVAIKAREILDVDEHNLNSFPPRLSSHPSQDFVEFVPPQDDPKEDAVQTLHSSSRIKQESAVPYLHPATNPSGSGTCLEFQQSKSPGTLYKNELPFRYEPYEAFGGRPSSSLLHPSFVYPGGSLPSTSSTSQPRYQTFSLNGHQHVSYQSAVLQDLTRLNTPFASYSRSDAESEYSPQYNFEVLHQKSCLICGDEASGCHYGVQTCGSCKVFFKRAMEGQQNYLCAGRNDCIIDKIRRKNCPACRLRKCIQAGMVLGGRKFKKFGKVKTVRRMDTVTYGQPFVMPFENQQSLVTRISNSTQELHIIPQLLNILQSIEPEVVYAGYDNTQPETPSSLLTSLNRLCERQLLCVVKWSKSLPGFRNLHIEDQITLLQYSWMSLMVFAMGWRSYRHVSGQMLYFAPDLILNEQRMKDSSIYSLCLSMWQIPLQFVKLQVTQEEFLCMKALVLLNTIPLEGLRSQSVFEEMRGNYIRELLKAICLTQKGNVASSQRYYQLTKLMDSMHEIVKKLHLFCLNTFLQSRTLSIDFPEMMSEVIAAQLPKILAGMVKPLIFHKK